MTSYSGYARNGRSGLDGNEWSQLKPCEVLEEEDWLQGGLIPWVDGIKECSVDLVHVDENQDEEGLCEAALLENPLHFKTIFTGIVVSEDVKDYHKFLRIGIEIPRKNHI